MFHFLLGKPLINYPIESMKKIGVEKIFVVVGYKKELFSSYLKDVEVVIQRRLLGTGDALLSTEPYLRNFRGTIIVMSGDIPLVRKETLKNLIRKHKENKSFATILTAIMENPKGYGRILRNREGKVVRICEETDLKERGLEKIKEINGGIYCFESPQFFYYLKKIKINPRKKEYYLTDIIELLSKNNKKIFTYSVVDSEEVLGVNTRKDLSKAEKILKMRVMDKLMQEGVTIVDPENTYIEEDVKVGKDTIIYPFTVIERDVSIGKNCRIGPFCRLREKTIIEDNVELGNFVELVRSR
ncbi:MAG: sugar phosphate nucleotidyltransferase, partial [Candidatus Omnitrophica bacterium]|nr:sugar phosphate nucleotidyltransferase [Candidatus Omnitrophota bacterium]